MHPRRVTVGQAPGGGVDGMQVDPGGPVRPRCQGSDANVELRKNRPAGEINARGNRRANVASPTSTGGV